jgi:Co/Zn/Cd efflux system component
MSRNLALGLVIVGVVLIAIAVIEHFTVSTLIVPHLGIYLGVLGLIVAGVGAWGVISNRA